jgi:hypothetical protein
MPRAQGVMFIKNMDVIFHYLTGEDSNTNPNPCQRNRRSLINLSSPKNMQIQKYFVEVEYKNTNCEYYDDLSIRDILEEIMQKNPNVLYKKLAKTINPWDCRFK